MLRPAPVDIELSQRNYWLVQLRWLASSAVIYGTFVASNVVGVPLDPIPLYLIGAAIAVYNSFFIIALKWGEVASGPGRLEKAGAVANAQIVIDLVFLTLLIHFAGGVENPFAFYFIFHVIIASILLSRRETFLQATLAIALFAGLVLGEFAGAIPHVHLFGPVRPDLAHDSLYVGSTLLVFTSTLYLAAYIATSIMHRLRERDREILGLTHELERKAVELEGAYHRLSDLEAIKSQHLRKVSHEIKAPLAAIQSAFRVVLDGPAREMAPRQRDMVERAERRTQGLLSLVGDLLILSRAREARLFTERKSVNPVEAAAKVVSLQGPRAASKDVTLALNDSKDVPALFADPEAVEQLLTNLVSNAVNYTPSGGRVDLDVDSVGDTVRFRVRDTGIGIPSADLPKIFQEFYRSENARRFSEEGTGLGLSIVRSIVETHGGEIDAESHVGVGSTFTVVLPCGVAPSGDLPRDGDEIPAVESVGSE